MFEFFPSTQLEQALGHAQVRPAGPAPPTHHSATLSLGAAGGSPSMPAPGCWTFSEKVMGCRISLAPQGAVASAVSGLTKLPRSML